MADGPGVVVRPRPSSVTVFSPSRVKLKRDPDAHMTAHLELLDKGHLADVEVFCQEGKFHLHR